MTSHTSLRPLLFAATLGLGVLASACVEKGGPSHPTTGSGPAKMMLAGGDSVNWGRIAPGKLKHEIKVVNMGGDTLRIKDVHPSCGCTTAPLDKKNLGPGDTATISVELDAIHKTGLIQKSLTITTNDSARPSLVVPLIAEITRDIAVLPDNVPPVMVKKVGDEGTTSVVLRNTSDHPVNVEPPVLSPSPVLVRFDMTGPKTLAPGDSMTLTLHVKVLKQEGGSAQFSLATSSQMVPKIELTVFGQVEPKPLDDDDAHAMIAPGAGAATKVMPAPKVAPAPKAGGK